MVQAGTVDYQGGANWAAKFLVENGPYVAGTIALAFLVVVIIGGAIREWWVTGVAHKRALQQLEFEQEMRKQREDSNTDKLQKDFEDLRKEIGDRFDDLGDENSKMGDLVRAMNAKLEGISYAYRGDDRGGRRNDSTG